MSVVKNRQQDKLKKDAALSAVEFVRSGNIIGLGTGSTARYAIEAIAERLKDKRLKKIIGIPSSKQTERLATHLGIPLSDLKTHPRVDLVIDGADEVDPDMNLIKGGGGALLREKVLAQASARNIIIVDDSKLSPRIGTKFPVPVEVLPFSWSIESGFLTFLGAKVILRKKKTGQLYVTDQKNYILDCRFHDINNPEQLEHQLNQRAGIIGNGLFIGLATDILIAGPSGIKHLIRK